MRTDLTFRPPKRIGFWTTDESLNIRKFLENFARERNFDPGNADHWYHVSHVEFLRAGVCQQRGYRDIGGEWRRVEESGGGKYVK